MSERSPKSNPPPEGEGRLTVNLPEEKRNRLKAKAATQGKTIRKVVEDLIDAWLAEG